MDTLMNYHNIIGAMRAYCAKEGLGLILMPGIDMAFTDGKTIYVPQPDPSWSDAEFTKWKMKVYHEAGHNKAPTDDLFKFAKDTKLEQGSFSWFLNIMDDYRQERIHTGEYEGRDTIMSKGRALHSLESATIIAALHEEGKVPEGKEQDISAALFNWTDRLRPEFQPDMDGLHSIMYDLLTPKQQEYTDKLKDYDDELNSADTAVEEAALMERLLKEVFEWTDEEIEESKEKNVEAGEGEDSNEGDEGSEGRSNDSGEDQNERSEGEDKDSAKEARISWRDIIPDNHDEKVKSSADLHIDFHDHEWKASKEGFAIHSDPRIITTYDDYKGSCTIHEHHSLANKLRKLLRVKSMKRWQHGVPKGKLSPRSLHKIVTDNDDYDIFRRKTSAINLDSAVTLLIDMSGSMGGKKWGHAANSAYALYCSLNKLRIPTEIIGFYSTKVDHFTIYKEFGQKLPEHKLKERLQNTGPHSSNEDAAAIMFAGGRLLKRKEPSKHLIVLSDGQPAGYTYDSMSNAINVVKHVEQKTPIQICGIGIMDSSVKQIYKDHAVVSNSANLEAALLEIIKNKFI